MLNKITGINLIHIGFHKTASTFMQEIIFRDNENLNLSLLLYLPLKIKDWMPLLGNSTYIMLLVSWYFLEWMRNPLYETIISQYNLDL